MSQARRLAAYALEDTVDERVHDAHSLGRDTSVRVYLLEHLVHVDGIAFPPGPFSFSCHPFQYSWSPFWAQTWLAQAFCSSWLQQDEVHVGGRLVFIQAVFKVSCVVALF